VGHCSLVVLGWAIELLKSSIVNCYAGLLAKISQRLVESDYLSHRFSMLIVPEAIRFSGKPLEHWVRGDESYLYLQILFNNF
jgi:hypothetical protein